MADVQLSTRSASVKTAYEANADTNAFTDAEKALLASLAWTATQAHNLSAATGDEVAFDFTSTVNKATSGNYTGIKLNVTETSAPGTDDRLLDLQVGGTSKFRIGNGGVVHYSGAFQAISSNELSVKTISGNTALYMDTDSGGVQIAADRHLGWSNSTTQAWQTADIKLYRDAAATLALRNSTDAQAFRIYNTYTNASNYERGFMRWNSNVLEIGTEAAGTGTARALSLQTGGTDRLKLDTTGSVQVTTALTVATLPATPAVGMIARVTDASAPSVGSTVSGGGAAAALVWYNGSNWTVIGI